MTRDDIIRMAREAGLVPTWLELCPKDEKALVRFAALVAALVAAAEREECARACDRMEKESDGVECCKWPTPADCAATIRARGNT